jgi:integrase
MKFTDKSIQALKPKDKAYVVTADSESRGVGRLQVKIYPTGTKKFQYQFFFESKKRMEIGVYGAMSLATARKTMTALSETLQNGKNPKDELKQIKIEKIKLEAKRTLKEMVADFYCHIDKNWAATTISRTKICFKADLLPFISDDIYPEEFTPDVARELIYKVYNRGAKVKSGVFRSDLMSLFKFAIDFDNSPEQFKKASLYNISINPIRDIHFDIPKNAGQRWLDESELHTLWHSTTLPKMTHLYFKLNIALAGQRVCEVYRSKLDEYDFDENILTIPVERIKIKSKGEHVVPISPLAKSVIDELILLRGSEGHFWPHKYKVGESAHVSTLRMALERYCVKHKMTIFCPRDLRRTCKTLMAKSGISKEYRDLLQQHTKRDVASIHYDRYDYLKEKREAIDNWTLYLTGILKL